MPSAGAGIASPAGARGATPSGKQPVQGREEGAAERVSAGPAPCSAVPEACREALGGCSHLCEPHPAGRQHSLPLQPPSSAPLCKGTGGGAPLAANPMALGKGLGAAPGQGGQIICLRPVENYRCLFFFKG